MSRIKVLLVEDDPIWADGISQLLSREADLELSNIASTPEQAMEVYTQADIVLMDLNLTGNELDGMELAAAMLRAQPTKIIMLTAVTEKDIILDAFNTGAAQYVSKADYLYLPHMIRSVMYANVALNLLVHDYSRLKTEQLLATLTPAERELLPLLEQGHSSRTIGEKLYKAHSTIKNQLGSILKKLNVRSRKQALEKIKLASSDRSTYIEDTF